MKLKAITLALFVAGLGASFAFADDGHHGKGKDAVAASSTTSSTSTSEQHGKAKGKGHTGDKKVVLCHKAGKSGKWTKVTVAKQAAKSKLKHGDVAPDASGKCPASTPKTSTGETETTETETHETATTPAP